MMLGKVPCFFGLALVAFDHKFTAFPFRAIESGANFLSEAFVFSVAASIIIAESWR